MNKSKKGEGKPIKAWAIGIKRSSNLALPDIFQTKEQAMKRMKMNGYWQAQHKWKVIQVLITPLS